jgi:hypothetical protein
MSTCRAGECDCVCGGNKGCGCIASSDNPDDCACWCFGDSSTGGLTVKPSEAVDVQISGLPLFEAARLLGSVHSRRVLVPVDIMNRRVRVKFKRKRFADVLKRLGLTTGGPRRKKTRRR